MLFVFTDQCIHWEPYLPSVFFSYSHADENLRDQLEKQLTMLKRQGVIETWHDRRIVAGQDIDAAIDERINSDEIILLLVSPDFLASAYCYDVEMERALERHRAGQAVVIPVILRHCEWQKAPFGNLLATPRDGKPIVSWTDKDEAFLDVAKAVRRVAEKWTTGNPSNSPTAADPEPKIVIPEVTASDAGPRSSNLRLAKSFTQRDKDRFRDDTFEYVARYFENSLSELQARNPSYEGVFRKVDSNRFFATIYKDGRDVARATIFMGGMLANGISYAQGQTTGSNSCNESLTVDADDQALHLTSMGMSMMGRERDQKLTQEGAAELLWGMLIEPLQRRQDW